MRGAGHSVLAVLVMVMNSLRPWPGVVAAILLTASLAAADYVPRRTGNFDFPVYSNEPPGRQLTGAHAPAATAPLAPEETERRFKVPPGFEVRLFASEPEVVNPVAMTWDERGRLWVVELYEYTCYQNAMADPDGVDRELGRIWRVVWVGEAAGKPVPSRSISRTVRWPGC